MKYPTREIAENLLKDAAKCNVGQWDNHSRTAAMCAEKIAKHAGLDSEKAYINSLLHDIGRRFGRTGMRHTYDGWRYLSSLGYDAPAQICLTHSFVLGKLDEMLGKRDFEPDEAAYMQHFLDTHEMTIYDRLGQICDYLALPDGACIIEQRMIDVAIRYGFNDYTITRWQKTLEIKADFDRLCKCDIYLFLIG